MPFSNPDDVEGQSFTERFTSATSLTEGNDCPPSCSCTNSCGLFCLCRGDCATNCNCRCLKQSFSREASFKRKARQMDLDQQKKDREQVANKMLASLDSKLAYYWSIVGTIVMKSPIFYKAPNHKYHTDCKYFEAILEDETSNRIRLVAYNEFAVKFFKKLKSGSKYKISNGRFETKHPSSKFSRKTTYDYEIHFNLSTKIERIEPTAAQSSIQNQRPQLPTAFQPSAPSISEFSEKDEIEETFGESSEKEPNHLESKCDVSYHFSIKSNDYLIFNFFLLIAGS